MCLKLFLLNIIEKMPFNVTETQIQLSIIANNYN